MRRVSTPSTPSDSATASQPTGESDAQRGDHDDRRDERQQVGDDLPAQDEDLLGVLELVADEQGEVEQRAGGEEVHADEDGERRQQVER